MTEQTLEALEKLGKVAGVGGIALGVVGWVMSDFIRRKFLANLTKQQSYWLLWGVIGVVWSIGVLGLCLWAYVETRPNPEHRPGKLEVTDVFVASATNATTRALAEVQSVSVDDSRADYCAVLDFRIVNRGFRPVAVNRVRFDVLEVETSTPIASAHQFSATYDADISDLDKVGESQEVVVSHSMKSGEIDRFAIRLVGKTIGHGTFRSFKLRPTLLTSEGEVAAQPVTFILPYDPSKPRPQK